jgi:hypothetical protein
VCSGNRAAGVLRLLFLVFGGFLPISAVLERARVIPAIAAGAPAGGFFPAAGGFGTSRGTPFFASISAGAPGDRAWCDLPRQSVGRAQHQALAAHNPHAPAHERPGPAAARERSERLGASAGPGRRSPHRAARRALFASARSDNAGCPRNRWPSTGEERGAAQRLKRVQGCCRDASPGSGPAKARTPIPDSVPSVASRTNPFPLGKGDLGAGWPRAVTALSPVRSYSRLLRAVAWQRAGWSGRAMPRGCFCRVA